MEQHGNEKECNTLGATYPRMNLSNVNGPKHLTWTVYNGVCVPGDPLALTGYCGWEHIIVGTTLT